MNLSSLNGSSAKPSIGNAAGWCLTFHEVEGAAPGPQFPGEKSVLTLGSDSYHAEIRAALPQGLEGGAFSITIEGLKDDDYKVIARKKKAPAFTKLYLFWEDVASGLLGAAAGALGAVAGAAGAALGELVGGHEPPEEALVAVLTIDQVARRAGRRRYETLITGREWIFQRVSSTLVSQPIEGAVFADALKKLLSEGSYLRSDKDFVLVDLPSAKEKTKTRFPAGSAVLSYLTSAGAKLERDAARFGRGMFLLRRGQLFVGPRPIPLKDGGGKGEPKDLTPAGGLVEVTPLAPVPIDPNFRARPGGDPKDPPTRRQFQLTLKGRPDLRPGDVVKFGIAKEEEETQGGGGLLDTLGSMAESLVSDLASAIPLLGDEVQKPFTFLYVTSVEHRLGRGSGFVTTIAGVELKEGEEGWDQHTSSDRGTPPLESAETNLELAAARAVQSVAHTAVAGKCPADIGEVTDMHPVGEVDPPAQTTALRMGLRPGDTDGHQARRVAVQVPSDAPVDGVPYATPFAWGQCGLLLPRYPGTRVLVVHRDGRANDPVDVGALWGPTERPQKAEQGDYWLILPVQASATSLAPNAEAPTPLHSGKVTHDLVDAKGNRIIEVGELTIRVGRDLKNVGQRPKNGEADAVTIEHTGGATIVIDKNGKITLKGKGIELDAGSGDITLKANKVDVAVTTVMDVH